MPFKISARKQVLGYLPLIIIGCLITASFVYGWYFDHSKVTGGASWADQKSYTAEAESFAAGRLPSNLHFSIGYPLLGTLGHFITRNDPFVAVSYLLMLASAVFCFLAIKRLYGNLWAFLFCLLLFYWHGPVRIFGFSADLFFVPWNNQVLFFAMSFYLWLFVARINKVPSLRLLAVASVISGFCFITREEAIIFIVPVMSAYLYVTKSDWKRWFFSFGIITVCYIPQVIVKLLVLGSATAQNQRNGYGSTLRQYFQLKEVHNNTWLTILDSRHIPGRFYPGPNVHRPALFQAEPWLSLSPLGVGLILFLKRFPAGLKVFIIISCALILFYLSGPNMSAYKLKFNCLRYIAPGLIALNLSVIILARELLVFSGRGYRLLQRKSSQ